MVEHPTLIYAEAEWVRRIARFLFDSILQDSTFSVDTETINFWDEKKFRIVISW